MCLHFVKLITQNYKRASSSSSVGLLAFSSSTVGFPAVYTLLLLLPPTVQDGIALFTVLSYPQIELREERHRSSPFHSLLAHTHTHTGTAFQQQTVWKTDYYTLAGTYATGLNTDG